MNLTSAPNAQNPPKNIRVGYEKRKGSEQCRENDSGIKLDKFCARLVGFAAFGNCFGVGDAYFDCFGDFDPAFGTGAAGRRHRNHQNRQKHASPT